MSRLMMRGIVAIALVAVTVSAATAQERERGGRRGFGGGFGGGPSALLGMVEVQKEIGLSEGDAKKLTEELRALFPAREGGNREDFRSLSEEQRTARREEMRKQMEEIGKKADEKIKATLTEAQYKRLSELRVQREGVGAFGRADVAEKLKLTTEQKEQIAKLQEEARPQFGRRGEGGNQGERPSPEDFRARREKLNADVVAVLTPEQKTAWENMQGAKFEFPAPNFGGGPGGGRPRGNRPAAE